MVPLSRQYTTQGVQMQHHRAAGLIGGVHFHCLRHTGISWLINKGVPPQFVRRIAGHSSLNVTRIYTYLEGRNLIAAVYAFDLPPGG
jgi:site-specific recombinase XerD